MIARAAAIAVLLAAAVPHAVAQTAVSTAGDIGSAVLRGGYPAGGGAITLPLLTPSPGAAAVAGSANGNGTTSTGGSSSTGASSSAGGSSGGGRAAPAARVSSKTAGAGGGDWVLCPPTGSTGFEPLFTGTDLSCAPR